MIDIDTSNIVTSIAVGISYGILIAVIIVQFISHTQERRIFNRQRSQLLNRIMAKDLTELAQTEQYIDNEPADDIKKLKAENELAVRAESIIKERQSVSGYPVM